MEYEGDDPSILWLKKLEISFKWEARILYIVAVACPLVMIHRLAGLAIAAVGVLFEIVMDTTFSVLVTLLFLRPISEALKNGNLPAVRQSQGYRRMQKTKWHTLIGSTLAVVSTTVVYINCILLFTIQGPFWEVPWLNVFVFGISMDSILNDIGMGIASGMLKDVTGTMFAFFPTAFSTKKLISVQPQPSFVANSQASEVYSPDEANVG
jgi:hypothetical protein